VTELLKVCVAIRYKDLTKSIPDDLKNTWYCQKVLKKLEKYGRVSVPFYLTYFV